MSDLNSSVLSEIILQCVIIHFLYMWWLTEKIQMNVDYLVNKAPSNPAGCMFHYTHYQHYFRSKQFGRIETIDNKKIGYPPGSIDEISDVVSKRSVGKLHEWMGPKLANS